MRNYLSSQVIIRVGNCTNFSFDDDNGHIHSLFQQLFTIDNHPNKTQCIIRKEKLPCWKPWWNISLSPFMNEEKNPPKTTQKLAKQKLMWCVFPLPNTPKNYVFRSVLSKALFLLITHRRRKNMKINDKCCDLTNRNESLLCYALLSSW